MLGNVGNDSVATRTGIYEFLDLGPFLNDRACIIFCKLPGSNLVFFIKAVA